MSELRIVDKVKLLVVDKFKARVFTRQELKGEWQKRYPEEKFDERVLIPDYCVNTIFGVFDGEITERDDYFLFRIEKGRYRIYDPQRDGKWKREGDRMVQI